MPRNIGAGDRIRTCTWRNSDHYSETASAWKRASLATHLSSRSVHPQPRASADYPRSLFGFPSFIVLGSRLPFPLRPRRSRSCEKSLVRSPGVEPGCLEDTEF